MRRSLICTLFASGFLLALIAGVSGCSVEKATACLAGSTRACACSASETQLCAEDGSGWLPCACADSGHDVGAGSAGAGGSGGDASVDGDAGDASVDGDAGDASVDGDAGDASVDGDAGDASVDGDAGDAGVDGDASVDGDAYDSGACGVCTALEVCGPNGLCLAAQKELGPGRSIDVTEVTRSQYGAWLATSPSTAAQPSYCTFNTAFTPSCYLPLDDTDANLPMVCIDWCDARAYCLGVGKRLCGHPSPAATPYASFADPSQSVWYEACTSSGVHPYPYGDAYQPAACNGPEAGQGALVEVAHFNQCQPLSAPYAGVFDLSGNAVEHEDSCETTIHGALDLCRVRGGSHVSPPGDLRCDFSWSVQRSWSSERLGFRCCSVP